LLKVTAGSNIRPAVANLALRGSLSDAELDAVNLTRHDFHGDWNYTISPKVLALER
jgi:hypothetical protein